MKTIFDEESLLPGDDWRATLDKQLREATIVFIAIGDEPELSSFQRGELERAVETGKRTIPVLMATSTGLPSELMRFHAVDLRPPAYEANVGKFITNLRSLLADASTTVDPEDPEKGRWGGARVSNGRRLSVELVDAWSTWCRLRFVVDATGDKPLTGTVEFRLHPTFPNPVVTRPVLEGRAILEVSVWGAFTLGAICDGGETTLELDISQDPSLPKTFRER